MDFFERLSKDVFRDEDKDGALTSEEIEGLILALAVSRGEEGFTEEEAEKLCRWAEEIRVSNSLIDLVLGGYAAINWSEKDNEPLFSITPKGTKAVKEGRNVSGDWTN